MIRIGILTFHRAHNYGAVLQCYALQEFLKSLGYESVVIDYNNRTLWQWYDWFKTYEIIACFQKPSKILKRLIKLPLNWYKRYFRYYNIKKFQERLLNLEPVQNILAKPFDIILIGSDQVWNTELTNGFDPYYWGTFDCPNCTIIATYAASLKKYWEGEEKVVAINNIKKLKSVAVRESKLAQFLIQSDSELRPIVVPDPVFLLSDKIWSQCAIKPKIKAPYVLYYQVVASEKVYNEAKKIARNNNKQLVVISAEIDKRNSPISRNASPFEFIGWIKYADLVITSSFHATAFSIIFEKDFYCLKLNMGPDNRISDVLKMFDLSERLISSADDCIACKKVDSKPILKKLKQTATDYICSLK